MVEHGGGKERGFVVKDNVSGDKKRSYRENGDKELHVSVIPEG